MNALIVILSVTLGNAAGETRDVTDKLYVDNPYGRCEHFMSEGAEKQVGHFARFDRVIDKSCTIKAK